MNISIKPVPLALWISVTVFALFILHGSLRAAAPLEDNFASTVMSAPADSQITVLVVPAQSFDLSDLHSQLSLAGATRRLRHQRVVEALKLETSRAQARLREYLDTERSSGRVQSYRAFWIANMVAVTTTPAGVSALASRPGVARVLENRAIYLSDDKPKNKEGDTRLSGSGSSLAQTEKIFNWALENMNVRPLWQRGLTGRGILVGNIDSGVDGNHPALAAKWRGAHGATVTESWYDAIRGETFPYDDIPGTHGTGTMGCMVGQTGADTIGVVPDAQWIAAKAFSASTGSSETIIRCMEWMADPDSDPATVDDVPDILNLSFADNASNGCLDIYWEALDNLKLLGVIPILASGNRGTGAGQHGYKVAPPANSPRYFAVTSVDSLWQWASESMPGPSACDPNIIKPDIVAPGHWILTTTGNNAGYINKSGSSFACPLTAGVAALVRQANPDLTPDEVYDVLRSSATDLGTVGPDTLFGYGAVNADNAVELAGTPSRPWLAITKIELMAGDDGLVSPGEDIGVVLTLTNNGLDASGVTAAVSSNSSDVAVTAPSADFGAIANGAVSRNNTAPFGLSFSQSVPQEEIRTFNVTLTVPGGQTQTLAFAVGVGGEPPVLVETYATHDINKAGMSITNYGTLGVDDNNGGGFVYPRTSTLSPDHLFQGGLMVATGAATVSDVSYRDNGLRNFNRDFKTVTGGNLEIFQPGEFADQEISAIFADSLADSPLDVTVRQRSYGWSNSPDEDYIIVEYSISGPSNSTLHGVRVAQHIDWDVNGGNSYDDDIAAFERSSGLAYMFDSNTEYYLGSVLLTQALGGVRLLNFDTDIDGGFSGQEKWAAMTYNPWSDTVATVAGDYSQIMAGGPVTLKPGSEVIVAFAVLGGEGIDDLRANASAARAKWAGVTAARGLDTSPPALVVTPMRNQAPERQNYTLFLTATDNESQVERVYVHWRDISPQQSAWATVTAGKLSFTGDDYQALLPVRPEGTRVQYWVQAIDSQGNQGIGPGDVPEHFYTFYIGDTTSPLLSSVSAARAGDGTGMLVSVTATDEDLDRVFAVVLPDSGAVDTLDMQPGETDSTFSGLVTGFELNSVINYYVEAVDTLGNYTRYPAAAPQELLQLTYTPVLAGDSDLNGKVDIFDVLAVLKVLSGKLDPSAAERAAMDVDLNGKVNIFDLIEILKLLKR